MIHSRKKQQGAILIFGLIVMLGMTMFALATMDLASFGQRMAYNQQRTTITFQEAETGLHALRLDPNLSTYQVEAQANFDNREAGAEAQPWSRQAIPLYAKVDGSNLPDPVNVDQFILFKGEAPRAGHTMGTQGDGRSLSGLVYDFYIRPVGDKTFSRNHMGIHRVIPN